MRVNICTQGAIISDTIEHCTVKTIFTYKIHKVSQTQYNAVQVKPYLHIKYIKTIYNK